MRCAQSAVEIGGRRRGLDMSEILLRSPEYIGDCAGKRGFGQPLRREGWGRDPVASDLNTSDTPASLNSCIATSWKSDHVNSSMTSA